MAYQKAIKAFYDAGCRYLQFDDTAWAYLCSQEELKKARDRGLDVDHLQETYTRCINKALEAKPADMTITTHVCRGNFRSTFISSGGYEPVAREPARPNATTTATSSNTTPIAPAVSSRCASCPRATRSSCSGSSPRSPAGWSRATTSRRRIDEATKYVALDQLCLSPQCGFASTEEGNVLAEDEQWAKLRMIVELADEVWGK